MHKKSVSLNKSETKEDYLLSSSLAKNIDMLKKILEDNDTVIYKLFSEPDSTSIKYCVVFVDTLSSEEIINSKIIQPLMQDLVGKDIGKSKIINYIINKVIACRNIKKSSDTNLIIHSLLYGDTILFMEGIQEALIISTKEWNKRAISEPESERVTKGPKEGFIEDITVNISLIERRIINPDLKFKFMEIGTVTKTKVCICYLEGIASKKILEELKKRLNEIEIDGMLESEYIRELIQDAPLSAFNTVGDTERPDVVAAKLLEGRIALICDCSPLVLTIPHIFIEYFQYNEDYYNNYIYCSINRLLRTASFFLTTSIPAIYLAIVTFHQELLPTPLMLSIAAARQDVPFPTIVELILMLFTFEVLRESGVRLPLAIGSAVSIVGALVLGEAAVSARLISAPMVVITAFTGISAFSLINKMKAPLIVIRSCFLISASILGLYGYMICIMVLVVYLTSIRSFGVPYMINTSLTDINNIKDTAVRAPLWFMKYRPKFAVLKTRSIKRGNR